MNGFRPRQDRDATDDRLGDDPHQHDEREHEEHAALVTHAPHEHDDGKGEDADEPRQSAIAEFDDTVNAHLRGVHQRIRRAAGPGRAPQSRAREADRAARADDEHLRHERQPREHPDPAVDFDGQPPRDAVQGTRDAGRRGGGRSGGHACGFLASRRSGGPGGRGSGGAMPGPGVACRIEGSGCDARAIRTRDSLGAQPAPSSGPTSDIPGTSTGVRNAGADDTVEAREGE
ncbi:hypothetical protein QE414_002396 [Microbacterium sp. SORGH_AS 344]|nr:hypothetical protein [Microbacterium sp. SORGH_AS_0344]